MSVQTLRERRGASYNAERTGMPRLYTMNGHLRAVQVVVEDEKQVRVGMVADARISDRGGSAQNFLRGRLPELWQNATQIAYTN